MTSELDPTLIETLTRIELCINSHDGTAIRERWECGRRIVDYYFEDKRQKQLPNGALGEIANRLGVVRSEVGARMKFYRMYSTEQQLSTAVETYKSWTRIRAEALVDRKSVRESTGPTLKHIFNLIDTVDPETLCEADMTFIRDSILVLKRLAGNIIEARKSASESEAA